VWSALLLRESVMRLSSTRGAWFWLLLEPVWHIGYMMVLFSVIRVRHIGGIETSIWTMVGLLAFFVFRRTATQAMNAVGANRALYTYRQVRPVDTVVTRSILEGLLMTAVSTILVAATALAGVDILPDDPIRVLQVFFGLWLFGAGFGLVTSVITELTPEIGRVIGLAMTPLYFISGVMFPVSAVPFPYRNWVMVNPLAHGIEAARSAFAPHYHAVSETSIGYLYAWALASVFLGMALHRRFATKLVMQ
jgi:capsular polysaccharide transport system permease protein